MQNDLFDTAFNEILASQTYDDFAARLRRYDCQRCGLCRTRENIVVDRGNPDAGIIAISERPGPNEDVAGKPFVGRSGDLLDKMFAAIGMDTNRDMLITLVAKCMPESERAPHRDEADACMPFLEKQIALVKPRLVILLGAVALRWIDPDRGEIKMEEEAGKFFRLPAYPGVQFVVMYNPAYVLRDPTKKRPAWEHLKSLRAHLALPA